MSAAEQTAAGWLDRWAATDGGRVALVDARTGVTHTATGLAARVANTARQLADAGVGPGDRVALGSHDEFANIVAFLATSRLGAAAVPLHRRATAAERREMLGHAVPKAVFCDDDRLIVDATVTRWTRAPAPAAMLLFTSGTTGRPRLAELGWPALAAATDAALAVDGLDPARWLACLPMSHVGGLSIVLRCLRARTTVVLAPFVSPEQLAMDAARHAVTAASLVPTQVHRLVMAGLRAPSTLSATLVGGAACADDLARRAASLGWQPRRTYGLTEACSQVTTARSVDDLASGPALNGISVGLEGVGPDGVGAIWLEGPTLFSGYRDPDGSLTPPGRRWFTGDLGRWVGSSLEVVTRRTDLVVTGGENVYPAEVEAALVQAGLADDAVVFGLADPEWGQVVSAALVGPRVDRTGLGRLRGMVAGYKLPRRWFELDALPLTSNQKVRRAEVQQLCAAGVTAERTREWVDE